MTETYYLCPEVKNQDGSPLMCQGEHCRFYTQEHGCIKAAWLRAQVEQIQFFLRHDGEIDDFEFPMPSQRVKPSFEERRELV